MEKSSPCFSAAQLLRHLLGLGRRGRKALVLSGSLGLRRCLWPHGSQAEVLCCGGGGGSLSALASAPVRALVPRPLFLPGKVGLHSAVPAAACAACGTPVLGTLLCLKETVGTTGRWAGSEWASRRGNTPLCCARRRDSGVVFSASKR